MIKEKQLLEDALARGVITPEQYAKMEGMVDTSINRNPDERFRIVSGFSEIFISIGLMMLLNASSAILWSILPNPSVAMVVGGGIAWLGAIYFNDKKRFLLPSIVCCMYSAHAMGSAIWAMQGESMSLFSALGKGNYWPAIYSLAAAFSVLVAAAGRFRIPFLMLPIGVLFAAIVTLTGHSMDSSTSYRLLLALCGITILGVALRFDLKDPHRVRRSSDFAFWCYVIGSPLTIHSMFITLIINSNWSFASLTGLAIPVMLVAFSFIVSVIALMLNRRALILSTLLYLGLSIGRLTAALGIQSVFVALVPMFLIGLYVVSLGTAWRRVRRALMTRLTPRPWFSKLPPF